MTRTIGMSAVFFCSLAAGAAAQEPRAVLVNVNGVPVSRAEVMERAFQRHGTVILNEIADEILVRQAADAAKVKADAKEVERRFRENRARFPDQAAFERSLAASGSSPEALRATLQEQVLREALVAKARGLKVSSEEVKKFFDDNKDRLGTPEAVRLRLLLVASQREADGFLAALRSGSDFAALAAQVSLDEASKQKGGDLGFITRGVLQPDIEKQAFSMKAGELASFQTPAGFAVLKVEERRKAVPPKFKDVRENIQRSLLADKITQAWPAYLKELRDQAKYETP